MSDKPASPKQSAGRELAGEVVRSARRASAATWQDSHVPASLLPDYSNQAQTYDLTRAASPLVLAALGLALAGAPGRRLADIGGGTGNYAARRWRSRAGTRW
jgi:hypothetical protein